ncbi:MAG TPA: VWA domain-containing protein [Thermoanaerobaculia bacterium]|nr:VWA domain-containing protein [Thermoanaerobaculia bacterium]
MTRRPRHWALTPLLAASLLAAGTLPGRGSPQAPEDPTAVFGEQVSVGYVLVPVVVRDGARYVQNLDKNDFRLLVDGRPVAVDSFERRSDAPASLVLLQDLSGSMGTAERILWSRSAASFFIDQAESGDEFAIASFSEGEQRVDVPFTVDLGALRESVATWRPWGKTALHDAVAHVPEISASGHNPKRFALLVTDGVDNASSIPPNQAREIVRRAQVPVYVLGLDAGSPYDLDPVGRKVYRYADVLNLLAVTSGGRYFAVSSAGELHQALAAIREDVRHQYVLGFATGEGRDRFRRLEVQVAGKRAVVFRRGYTGPPPAVGAAG